MVVEGETAAYCPECGSRRQQGWRKCQCGHVFSPPKVKVTKDKVIGQSPITLPSVCVKCGRDDVDGQRREDTFGLFAYAPWDRSIYVPLLLAPLFNTMWNRGKLKYLQMSYFLCDDCAKSRKTKMYITIASLVVLFVPLTALMTGLTVSAGILLASLCYCGCYGLAILWLVSYKNPLRMRGCRDGVFTVKGTTEAFHATMKRMDASYKVEIRTARRHPEPPQPEPPAARTWLHKPLGELFRR